VTSRRACGWLAQAEAATVVVTQSSTGRDAGFMVGGMVLGAACAAAAGVAFARFKRQQQVRAELR
jgi:high-affinity Fe2+/Pb2+ permease